MKKVFLLLALWSFFVSESYSDEPSVPFETGVSILTINHQDAFNGYYYAKKGVFLEFHLKLPEGYWWPRNYNSNRKQTLQITDSTGKTWESFFSVRSLFGEKELRVNAGNRTLPNQGAEWLRLTGELQFDIIQGKKETEEKEFRFEEGAEIPLGGLTLRVEKIITDKESRVSPFSIHCSLKGGDKEAFDGIVFKDKNQEPLQVSNRKISDEEQGIDTLDRIVSFEFRTVPEQVTAKAVWFGPVVKRTFPLSLKVTLSGYETVDTGYPEQEKKKDKKLSPQQLIYDRDVSPTVSTSKPDPGAVDLPGQVFVDSVGIETRMGGHPETRLLFNCIAPDGWWFVCPSITFGGKGKLDVNDLSGNPLGEYEILTGFKLFGAFSISSSTYRKTNLRKEVLCRAWKEGVLSPGVQGMEGKGEVYLPVTRGIHVRQFTMKAEEGTTHEEDGIRIEIEKIDENEKNPSFKQVTLKIDTGPHTLAASPYLLPRKNWDGDSHRAATTLPIPADAETFTVAMEFYRDYRVTKIPVHITAGVGNRSSTASSPPLKELRVPWEVLAIDINYPDTALQQSNTHRTITNPRTECVLAMTLPKNVTYIESSNEPLFCTDSQGKTIPLHIKKRDTRPEPNVEEISPDGKQVYFLLSNPLPPSPNAEWLSIDSACQLRFSEGKKQSELIPFTPKDRGFGTISKDGFIVKYDSSVSGFYDKKRKDRDIVSFTVEGIPAELFHRLELTGEHGQPYGEQLGITDFRKHENNTLRATTVYSLPSEWEKVYCRITMNSEITWKQVPVKLKIGLAPESVEQQTATQQSPE